MWPSRDSKLGPTISDKTVETLERMRTLSLKTTYHDKSFPLPPLSMMLCHQNSSDETLVLPNNIELGEGGGKAFLQSCQCFHTRNLELRTLIVSTYLSQPVLSKIVVTCLTVSFMS